MKQISIHSFKEAIERDKNNPSVAFINVCTPTEYAEKHISGVSSMPLDELETKAGDLKDKTTVYVHCQSGNRSQKAIEKLQGLGITAELVNVEGGLMAWDSAGFATDKHTNRIPLMRQVLIAAGSLVLLGYLLSVLVAGPFIYISVFVGAGLLFAGLSGWCGMSFVLAKMPWNQ